MLGLWLLFGLIVGGVMVYDLGVLQKRAHAIPVKEAAALTALWAFLALCFSGAIAWSKGSTLALQFLTGYILEMSLSVDNMFVFVMIFHYFAIPDKYQGRILHWGIMGAVIMRLIFILVGVALIRTFSWMIYVFGALLIFTGLKMLFSSEDDAPDLAHNPALRLMKRFIPIAPSLHEEHFFVRLKGAMHATPLFAALIVVEFSDVIFALDSIPAVIAVSPDTFVVYTSNIFAIMGLRALYFMLAGLVGMFRFLKLGISLILVFIGIKMLIGPWYHVTIGTSLGIIAGTLALSVAASLLFPEKKEA